MTTSEGKRERVVIFVAGAIVMVALVAMLGPSQQPKAPTTRNLTGGSALRGLALELYQFDRKDHFERELDELAEMQSQVLCVSVSGCQENVSASRVFIDHFNSPRDETVLAVIRGARRRGMQVLLLPIVLLWDLDSNDDWRGRINPRSWDRWWESYERFIVHYAELAEEAGAEMLSVGSELISTEHKRSDWIKVIDKVRSVYHGKLLYSANWDHYREVSFWDKLDLIGMTSYHTVADDNSPSPDSLRARWKPIKQEILAWQQTQNRPIVFTEVGYPSQDGCAREPWNYFGTMRVDLEEQVLCLQAFFETWTKEPAVAAICLWKWDRSPGGRTDYNYTPRGKPAMELVRQWLLGGPLPERPSSLPSETEPALPEEPAITCEDPDREEASGAFLDR